MSDQSPKSLYEAPNFDSIEISPERLETLKLQDTFSETDRNAPEEPSNSSLGDLRRQVVSLQGKINQFLTSRMKESQQDGAKEAETLEKQLLDGDVEEEDE